MVTRFCYLAGRSALVLLHLAATLACGRLLGIEDAHVDPILDDTQAQSDEPPNDTVEVDDSDSPADAADATKADASSERTSDETSDTTNECMSFDNRRVRHLKSDGTLTPLPNIDPEVDRAAR